MCPGWTPEMVAEEEGFNFQLIQGGYAGEMPGSRDVDSMTYSQFAKSPVKQGFPRTPK
jgi:hypothetical protein